MRRILEGRATKSPSPSVKNCTDPSYLIEELHDGQNVAGQFVRVRPTDAQDNPGVIATLAPPSHCQVFKVDAIVSDEDSRLAKSERELFFVWPAQVTYRKCCQAVHPVRSQQWREQHVHVFVQVNSQRRQARHHGTWPVAGSKRLPAQVSGMRLAAISASISCRW